MYRLETNNSIFNLKFYSDYVRVGKTSVVVSHSVLGKKRTGKKRTGKKRTGKKAHRKKSAQEKNARGKNALGNKRSRKKSADTIIVYCEIFVSYNFIYENLCFLITNFSLSGKRENTSKTTGL